MTKSSSATNYVEVGASLALAARIRLSKSTVVDTLSTLPRPIDVVLNFSSCIALIVSRDAY